MTLSRGALDDQVPKALLCPLHPNAGGLEQPRGHLPHERPWRSAASSRSTSIAVHSFGNCPHSPACPPGYFRSHLASSLTPGHPWDVLCLSVRLAGCAAFSGLSSVAFPGVYPSLLSLLHFPWLQLSSRGCLLSSEIMSISTA